MAGSRSEAELTGSPEITRTRGISWTRWMRLASVGMVIVGLNVGIVSCSDDDDSAQSTPDYASESDLLQTRPNINADEVRRDQDDAVLVEPQAQAAPSELKALDQPEGDQALVAHEAPAPQPPPPVAPVPLVGQNPVIPATGPIEESGRLRAPVVPSATSVHRSLSNSAVSPESGIVVGEVQQPPAEILPPESLDREGYDLSEENDFLNVIDEPLSTFSIDVDPASYSNVRRFIQNGQRPPIDAVRIEELINYFTYDYPEPEGDHPFSVVTEVSEAPWNPQHQLVQIGLQGQPIPREDQAPNNLVFLIDVSGSMSDSNKLPLLKSAFQLLIDELRAEDQVSIVVYAGAAGVVLPPTPGDEKDQILSALEYLQAGGSTAGGEGIELAYQLAQDSFLASGNNRVILATDGDFNVGISSDSELIRLIESKRENDIFLTVLGFGEGNLQDAKMEQLANHGNGNYAYIDSLLEAKKVLVQELGATLITIAKDVKLQIEFNPAKVQAYRLIGYENRLLENQDFNDDTKDAGEMGAGHSVTALYEIIPVGIEADQSLPEVDPLRYQTTQIDPDAADNFELLLVKLRCKQPTGDVSQVLEQPVFDLQVSSLNQTSDNFRFAAAVAAFGMVLRESPSRGSADVDLVLDLAEGSQGEDREGYRSEFLELVERFSRLP